MRLPRAIARMVESGSITRREANHMVLADDEEFQKKMMRNARDKGITRKKQTRRQRNNFREY